MHKNINKWLGEGQIKGDFTLRQTQNNYKVTNFLLKINTAYKVEDQYSGLATYKEEVVYVPVVAWNKLAQSIVEKYNSNDIVRVVGRLKNSNKFDSSKDPSWEIVLEDISLIKSS
jgi:single-stranded DNA-binding protein